MPKYKMCYVDFDSVLYRTAKSLQKDYIIATHNTSGEKLRFNGVSEFRGVDKGHTGGWIGEQKLLLDKEVNASDYTVESFSEIISPPEPDKTLIEYALSRIDFKVGEIKQVMDAEDYRLGIGGGGVNFRYAIANIIPYKHERADKPIMYQELREAFINKYKSKVLIARDNLEQDDEVSIRGWESYKHFVKTGKHKYVLAYIDKDLKQVPCPHFNYDKCEDGIITPTVEDCARAFTTQLLVGDKVDTIVGLPNISPEFAKKYGVRKSTGVGAKTAEKLLSDCITPKQMYERVIEAYKSYYGESVHKLETFRDETLDYAWLDFLKENASLLYMLRSPNEKYCITDTLKRLDINY